MTDGKQYDPEKKYEWRPVMEKTGYKYSVKASQSLTTGTVAFECYFAFDNEDEFLHSDNGAKFMRDAFDSMERTFVEAGYKVAKTSPTNSEKKTTATK